MPFLVILIGFVFLLYVMSRFMQQSHSGKLNRLMRYGFAVVLGLLAFLILVRGNIPVGGILGFLSYLSAQGSLWNIFGGSVDKKRQNPRAGLPPMSREEALEILGLSGTPGQSEIRAAHHKMMLKFHPDQGGSDYFATKLNQARDLLL